jgi:hypothetical protein
LFSAAPIAATQRVDQALPELAGDHPKNSIDEDRNGKEDKPEEIPSSQCIK